MDIYAELFDQPDYDLPALASGEIVTFHLWQYGTLAGIPIDEYHALVATAQLATEYRAQVDILKEIVESQQKKIST